MSSPTDTGPACPTCVYVPSSSSTTGPSGSTGAPSTDVGSTASPHSTTSPTATDSSSSSTATPTKSTTVAAASVKSNAGAIAGGVIGGVVLLVLLVLGTLLYLRARKRKRTPPSSEFINSIRAGAAPVLRLDSGAEYTPALSEKGGGAYTRCPPAVPLPFTQDSYYTSPPMQDMKFPDEMMVTDIPSGRPSVEKPLHPQRFSSQQTNDSFVARHHPSTSVGSRRELWGSDFETVPGELSPVRQSPMNTDSVLQFTPCFSLDDASATQPSHFSHSPSSLHPLRRQPSS